MLHYSISRVRLRLIKPENILITLFILNQSAVVTLGNNSTSVTNRNTVNFGTAINFQTGPLTDSSNFDYQNDQTPKSTPALLTGSVKFTRLRTNSRQGIDAPKKGDRKHDDNLSTDCTTKRREIMRKQGNKGLQTMHDNQGLSGYQRLKPNHAYFNRSLDSSSNSENEHVPTCTHDGKFEPIQCHRIGYCWCVNKFGQAIKNSATLADEKPTCDTSLYESESNDLLVVTGVSAHRMKGLLKVNGASSTNYGSSSLNGNSGLDLESDSDISDSEGLQQFREQEDDFSRRVSTSPEPSLALVPNECALSRQNAIERALKHTDDSIWIPECDSTKEKLYAERQCHKSKVCWCVDQDTGLPLRTSEQLTKQTTINCTEIKRIIDIASTIVKQNSNPKPSMPVFRGFSVSCDADRRAEFVSLLISQFRKQLSEFLKFNPTYVPPESFKTANPYRLSESQISIWKFNIMDQDINGMLDDREWSKFKVNFKLVEKFDDIHRPHKQESNSHFSMIPLNIVRAQRHCWRDFLQFCADGDIFSHESITLSKWLSCTEIPARGGTFAQGERNRGKAVRVNSDDVPDAYTRAAAIARSKKKNPFLGILKPD